MTRLKQGCWTGTVVPFNQTHSVIQVWWWIWAPPHKRTVFILYDQCYQWLQSEQEHYWADWTLVQESLALLERQSAHRSRRLHL